MDTLDKIGLIHTFPKSCDDDCWSARKHSLLTINYQRISRWNECTFTKTEIMVSKHYFVSQNLNYLKGKLNKIV